MWKAGAATAWCRWVQRDAAPTDSAMQHREGSSFLAVSLRALLESSMCHTRAVESEIGFRRVAWLFQLWKPQCSGATEPDLKC